MTQESDEAIRERDRQRKLQDASRDFLDGKIDKKQFDRRYEEIRRHGHEGKGGNGRRETAN